MSTSPSFAAHRLTVQRRAALPPVETNLAVTLRFRNPCRLSFDLPVGTEDVRRLEFVMTGPSGFRYTREKTRSQPSAFKERLGLVTGRYTVRATTPAGHVGELAFAVRALETPAEQPTIRVTLR